MPFRRSAMFHFTALVAAIGGCASADDALLEPVVPEGGCAAGETADSASACQPAGVPADACAPGFEPDGFSGCRAILPAAPCPPGQFARLGETTCRSVASCGAAPWGDIPTDASTEHVDASYVGGASDGSAASPWTTIQAGIDAAQPGAIVAVAAGVYAEDLDISGSHVRLWGRCPDVVEVSGQSVAGAISVAGGASGTEIRGVAVRGPQSGIVVSGSSDVRVQEVWVHNAGKAGIVSISVFGLASIVVSDTLIENVIDYGIFVIGTAARIERVVVRDVLPLADGTRGHGIGMDMDETPGTRAVVQIDGAVVERYAGFGILVGRSDAQLDGVLVRDPGSYPTQELAGPGVVAYAVDTAGQRANLTMSASVVERCRLGGVILSGSDMTLDTTVVRDTGPREIDLQYGLGLIVQHDVDTLEASTAALSRSLVDRSLGTGIYVRESEAVIEALLVRGTQPQLAGNAIGDGMVVDAANAPASATVTASRFEANDRAGTACVGAQLALDTSRFECNSIHLNGEKTEAGVEFTFVDGSGNACGCAEASEECKVLSSGLDAPQLPSF